MKFTAAFLLYDIIVVNAQVFNIPLPFGGLGIQKTEDGKFGLKATQDVNFFGWGGRRGFELTSKNGTFNIAKEDTAYVNGTEYGGANSFDFDKKKGIDVGANVTLADHKAVGGIGKETNFLQGLLSAISSLGGQQQQRRK